MFGPIVVPLDGSPLAEHALPDATALARILDAPITLLHVRRTDELPDEGAPDLDAHAARLRAAGALVDTHVCQVPRGDEIGRAILDAAIDRDGGLIVMATHGRGGLGRLIYGSVTDQVLRQARIPVVLVPSTSERTLPTHRPLRILVPLDGSETAEVVLSSLRMLAGVNGARLILLRVAQTIELRPHGDECARCRLQRARGEEPDLEQFRARRYVAGLADQLRASNLAVEAHVEIGGAASTIVRLARELDVDLIAMATHGRVAWRGWCWAASPRPRSNRQRCRSCWSGRFPLASHLARLARRGPRRPSAWGYRCRCPRHDLRHRQERTYAGTITARTVARSSLRRW